MWSLELNLADVWRVPSADDDDDDDNFEDADDKDEDEVCDGVGETSMMSKIRKWVYFVITIPKINSIQKIIEYNFFP